MPTRQNGPPTGVIAPPPHVGVGPPVALSKSEEEACAGCKRTGLDLLLCDDLVSADDGSPPSDAWAKKRYCANCMIGKSVRVFWPLDERWYVGVVHEYNVNTGEHLLKYPDGDTEWVKIGDIQGPDGPYGGPGASRAIRGGGAGMGIGPPGGLGAPRDISPPKHFGPDESNQYGGHHTVGAPGSPDRGRSSSGRGRSAPTHMQPHFPYGAGPGGMPMYHGHPGGPHTMGNYPPGNPSNPPPGMPPHFAHSFPPGHGGPHPGAPQYPYHPQMMNMPPGGMHSKGMGQPPPDETGSGGDGGAKRKSGPKTWTKEEDAHLLALVQNMRMPMKWSIVAQSMQDRTGKQCRERYVNHLNPRLKMTEWNPIEDATIFHLYNASGSHWAKMSKMVPGRTDNGIKNRFHNLRRQLEREDEHRLRLSREEDYPEEVRLDQIRKFPKHLRGKSDALWDMHKGIGVLAAQSVLGGAIARNAGRFGPFREPSLPLGEQCARCGLLVPSVQCGNEICTKTKWCQTCTRIPPHVSSNLLRECLNLRRCPEGENRAIIESWAISKRDASAATDTDMKMEG